MLIVRLCEKGADNHFVRASCKRFAESAYPITIAPFSQETLTVEPGG